MIRLLRWQVAVRFVRDANINLQAFDMWQAAFVNYPDTPWRRSAVAYLQARCLALPVGTYKVRWCVTCLHFAGALPMIPHAGFPQGYNLPAYHAPDAGVGGGGGVGATVRAGKASGGGRVAG